MSTHLREVIMYIIVSSISVSWILVLDKGLLIRDICKKKKLMPIIQASVMNNVKRVVT
jgi:hypothetical protein